MIVSLIDNEKALNLLSNNDVEWPLLSDDEWIQLKELCPFLEQFKQLTLYFSKTTECRMSDLCLVPVLLLLRCWTLGINWMCMTLLGSEDIKTVSPKKSRT